MRKVPHVDRARIYVSFADEDRARAMELVRWLNDSGWHVVADDRHSFAPDDSWSPSSRLEFVRCRPLRDHAGMAGIGVLPS